MPASLLTKHILQVFHERSGDLFTGKASDVYAVGFLIEVHDEPSLVITTNTETTAPKDSASNETRWNYACWAQEPLVNPFGDERGSQLLEEWFAQYTEGTSQDEVFMAFGELADEAARTVHADGTIQRVFGRPIPIIFHDLEGRDQVFDWTRAANPDGLADEFLNCGGGWA